MSSKKVHGDVTIRGKTYKVESGFGRNGKVVDGPGMDIVSGSHLEGKAVQLMNRLSADHCRLMLPPSKNTCHWCKRMVPKMLKDGQSIAIVQGISGGVQNYKGSKEADD